MFQSISHHPTSLISRALYAFLVSSCLLDALPITILLTSNYVWGRIRILMPPVMQFSPTSYYFMLLCHPVLKYPHDTKFYPKCQETKFHTKTKPRQNSFFVYLNCYVFTQEDEMPELIGTSKSVAVCNIS
jgi:hypothetical protein